MNKNNVSTIQKISAYILIALTLITYTSMRAYKNKKHLEAQEKFNSQVEMSLSETLFELYNGDRDDNSIYQKVHSEYKNGLVDKFTKPSNSMKDTGFILSTVKLNKKRIYSKKIKGIKHIIFDGTVTLQWSNTKTNTKTDESTKKITGFLLEEDEVYFVANIDLESID